MSESDKVAKNLENVTLNGKGTTDCKSPTSPRKRLISSSSIENLSSDTRCDLYNERIEIIKNQLNGIDINKLEITENDLKDSQCDPNNPVKVTFNDVSAAAYRIKAGIEMTPCNRSHMSDLTDMEIYFKKDFLQYTGSFKERGGRYSLLKLSKEQKHAGVVAASAGNHALALSYHGKNLKVPVLVVMPKIAPIMKVSNCRSYGAIVLVAGQSLADSKRYAMKIARMLGMTYINGYDHPDILAGQGTMGLEIIEQVPDVDAIVVPTGGAGLLAGIAVVAKSIKPDILIISAESDRCPSFYNSIKNGKPTITPSESTIADGLAVSLIGVNAFHTAKPLIDKTVIVKEEYVTIAILRLLELEKAVVEGAGAVGFAAVLQGLLPELKGKKVVIPLCGGNIDTTVLGRVLERALVIDSRLVKMLVTISDRAGSLAEFCKLVSIMGGSIKDMYHERAWLKNDMFLVQVQAVIEIENADSAEALEKAIREKYDNVVMGPYGLNHMDSIK